MEVVVAVAGSAVVLPVVVVVVPAFSFDQLVSFAQRLPILALSSYSSEDDTEMT